MAVLVAVLFFISNLAFDFDLFDKFVTYLQGLERYELDDAFLGLCIILIGVIWDLVALDKQGRYERKLQDQRLHILKATMVTVMDITNSLLASVRLFLYEVDAGKKVSTSEIAQLDESMKKSVFRLKTLQGLESITEIEIDDDSIAIDIEPEPNG